MPAQVLFQAPITFDVGDQLTHAPMVQATVRGTPTRLILDTGCSDHIFTIELANQVGLETGPGESGTDSTGASVPSWTVGEAAVEIGSRAFDLHDVVAITAPGPFPGWGIGGFLSPQHLLHAAWAVLDLADDLFFLVDGEEADVVAWLTARQPAMRLHHLARVPGDGTILVRAAVEPFGDVVTMLDSGGKRTSFAAPAVPGLGGGPMTSSGRGVGGTEKIGSEVRDRVLRVGGARLPLASVIVGEEMEGRAGLVGMDLLRGTVLTVSGEPDRPVLWQTG